MLNKKAKPLLALLLAFLLLFCSCQAESTSGGGASSSVENSFGTQQEESLCEHELKRINKKEATCKEAGNEAYFECVKCGDLFSDILAMTKLDAVPVLPAAHNYKITYVDETYHTIVCPTCGDTIKEEHAVSNVLSNIGHIYNTQCDVCNTMGIITKIPKISIVTDSGQDIEGDRMDAEYYPSTVSVSECDENYVLTNIRANVKVRGNFTANAQKKPYRIKFDKKQTMLGLNDGLSAKNWVLLAEVKDMSMLRNSTMFYLGNQIFEGDGLYCTDYRYVEVYINNKYTGMYLLAEQQEINKNRIAINEADDDYTGTDIGYLLELDHNYTLEAPTEQFAMTYKDMKFIDVTTGEFSAKCAVSRFEPGITIKSDIYDVAQTNFIHKVLQNIYDIAYDALYEDHSNLSQKPYKTLDQNGDVTIDISIKTTREAVERVINVQSLVDDYIVNELGVDMDVGRSSFYMSIDMSAKGDKKLTFQAPWDWDSSLGFSYPYTDEVICAQKLLGRDSKATNIRHYTNPWLLLLTHEKWFWDEVYEKWTAVKTKGVFTDVFTRMDDCSKTYGTYYQREEAKWTMYNPFDDNNSCDGYNKAKGQVAAKDYLKSWLGARIEFLDGAFKKLADLK